MNTKNVNILLFKYRKYQKQFGFTLIELLIVVIIIGILSAIALPNFITQVGKARQTEAKINLGTIGRAQQAYHFEHQTFASTLAQLSNSDMFLPEYYNYPVPDTATNLLFKQRAIPIDDDGDQVRDYALGVYFNSGSYQIILCEGKSVREVVEAPDSFADSCTNDGIKIQ